MNSMSRGDNYLHLMKLRMVLLMVSMIEAARWVEEEGQRVVRPTDWLLQWECCPGEKRPVCFNWKLPGRVRVQQITVHICYSMYIGLSLYLLQLSSTAWEKTSELMYDLFSDPWSPHPCLICDTLPLALSVLNVTVTTVVSWNAEIIAA